MEQPGKPVDHYALDAAAGTAEGGILMAISEAKMKIVIDNYFKAECDVNTSIREAFEKGFRIGVMKGMQVKSDPRKPMAELEDQGAETQRDYCEQYEPTYNPKDGSM